MKAIRRAWLALLAPLLLADQPVVPESLDTEPVATDPADRLQAQADRLTPDPRRLQDLALRKQIVLAAGPHPMEGRP